LSKLLGERLDAKADERREASVADSARQFPRDEAGYLQLALKLDKQAVAT